MQTSRFKVVAVHFALSAALLGALLLIMVFFWYPSGLFGIAGGWQGLQILAPIDLVLGPLLTLMFYRAGKKGAFRDLAMIGCVQIAALSYGMHAVYSQRPVALVFAEGAFVAMTPGDAQEANAKLLSKDYQPIDPSTLSQARPAVVVARPVPREEMGSYTASLFNDMPELAFRSDRFEPVSDHIELLTNAAIGETVDSEAGVIAVLPLKTKYGKGELRLNLESQQINALKLRNDSTKPATAALNKP